jgi:predicted AAA+ superfamily ATPase
MAHIRTKPKLYLEMTTRIYLDDIQQVLSKQNVMLFIMGPRQVGKTTISQMIAKNYNEKLYLNWDIDDDREKILSGQKFIEKIFPINRIINQNPLIIFDGIHKYKNWKNFLKGFYDLYKDQYHIIVTGSAHLDIFQKGGDSLMGRYIPYSIHPFSLGELNPNIADQFFKAPYKISEQDTQALYDFGGFPSPFLQREMEWSNQWKRTRRMQLFREDIRGIMDIREISQLELCAQMLIHQSGRIVNRSTIAKKLQVSIPTISRWIELLKQFYFLFPIYPWSNNIPHSLIKEPKIYLCDWSLVPEDSGAKFENLVACHLKKSVDFWTEKGLGEFGLYFLRDKKQREVDFVVTKDQKPWFLVEVKTSMQSLSPAIKYYQMHTNAPFAFQVTRDMDYVDYDCFKTEGAFVVPYISLLSQLV